MGYVPPLPKSRSLPRPLLLAVGGFLLFGAMFGLLIVLLRLFDSSEPATSTVATDSPELLAWAPANTEAVAWFNFKELRMYPDVSDTFSELFFKSSPYGFKSDGLEKGFVFMESMHKNSDEAASAFRLLHTYNPNEPIKAKQAKAQKYNQKDYLVFNNGMRLHNPQAPVVILYKNEKALFEKLDNRTNRSALSAELTDYIRQAQGPCWVVAVGPMAQPDVRGLWQAFGKKTKVTDEPHPLRLATIISTNIRAQHTDLTITNVYSSDAKAKTAAAQIVEWEKESFKLASREGAPEDMELYLLRVLYDTMTTEDRGASVVTTCRLPHKELKRIANRRKS